MQLRETAHPPITPVQSNNGEVAPVQSNVALPCSPKGGHDSAEVLSQRPETQRADAEWLVSCVKNVTPGLETKDYDPREIVKWIRSEYLEDRITQIRKTFGQTMQSHGWDRKKAKNELKKKLDPLKKQLPGALWSGTYSLRGAKYLTKYSGLLCADLDKLGGRVAELREKLKADPHVWALFLSPTGDGLKAVYRVPADVQTHFRSFLAVEKHVKDSHGVEIDESCKDIARVCFLSHDPGIYFNEQAVELPALEMGDSPNKTAAPATEPQLIERRKIAEGIVGDIDWQSSAEGMCDCPGRAEHSTADKEQDCMVFLDRVPTIYCFHHSCRKTIEGLNYTLRSRIGKAERDVFDCALGYAKNGGEFGADKTKRARQYALCDMAAITASAVDWLEEPYLARGEMHFLQGQGGSYKGTLTLTWAAEFSRRNEHALLVLAEDDLAKKVKPVLMAAGAKMEFIHPLTIRAGEYEDALILPDDLGQLEKAIADTQAKFVVIDPLLSHVSGTLDSYRDHDMKLVLTRIGKLAQRYGAVIVCVHHTKKDTSGGVKMAGAGSIAFYTTARLVLTMAKISEQEVVLEVVKSNLGMEGARQLLQAEIIEVAPGISVPKLTRAGESPVSVAEALAGERKEKESKTVAAAKLMLDILETEGEQRQSELFDRVAEETGLKPGSIRRHAYFGILVEEGLVESQKEGFKAGWLVARSERERPRGLRDADYSSKPKMKGTFSCGGWLFEAEDVTTHCSKAA